MTSEIKVTLLYSYLYYGRIVDDSKGYTKRPLQFLNIFINNVIFV